MKRLEAKKQDDLTVFDWFKTRVIPLKLEPSIGHHELVSDLFHMLDCSYRFPNCFYDIHDCYPS